jgi:hypothetical protein
MRRVRRAVIISAATWPLQNAIKLQDSHRVPPCRIWRKPKTTGQWRAER